MKNFILTVADLTFYTVAVVAVSLLLPTADFSLPWWGALAAPAVLYTLLVVMCCPRASTPQAIGIVALLFAAHAALASATGIVYATVMALPYPAAFAVAAWEYLPAPLLQLFCVSLLVLPFRAMYAPRRARRRGSLSVSLAGTAAAEPRLEGFPIEMPETAPAAPASLPAPSAPALAAAESSSPSPISRGAARGAERVEEVVSIPFARIADQIPAGTFTISPERLGANLLEPGHLLVPTRIVIAQLAEGAVSVSWDEVADQFPRHALAVKESTVRDRLPEGRIVLPLDEIVRRLPPEMFATSTPVADVQGIERFPLPFQPFESEVADAVEPPAAPAAPEAVSAPPSAESVVMPEPAVEIEALEPAAAPVEASRLSFQLPADTVPADSADFVPSFLFWETEIEYGLAPQAAFEEQLDALEAEPGPGATVEPSDVAPPPVEFPSLESLLAEPLFVEVLPVETVVARAPIEPPLESAVPASPVEEPTALEALGPEPPAIEPPAAPAPRVEPPRLEPVRLAPSPAPPPLRAPRPSVPLTEDRLQQSRNLAAVLTPFGALEVGSTSIEGVTLVTFNSSDVPTDVMLRTASSTLSFLMSGRAPWTVDQLTVRRERGAIILTPLGAVDSGGPVMVASVGRVGSLAMLELVCLKAAREHRLAYPASPARREPLEKTESGSQYETRDSGGLPLGFLPRDLNAFGRVAPTVLRDSAGDTEVCVFLAPGEDSRAVAGFAVDVCRALTLEGNAPLLGALQSVVFRLGRRRLVVRPVKGVPGRFSVLVAAGETAGRPGLAHRQLERAATLLRAV
jgi:hypothetical protein